MQEEHYNILYKKKKNNLIKKKVYTIFLDKEIASNIKYVFIIFFIIVFNYHLEYIEIDNEISLYEKNIDFSNYKTDIKTIALYLPQFYSFKENNEWWEKGFTEWYNVRRAKPLYNGHHQPRIPGDNINYLGYYDLTNVNFIEKQIQLAKMHGIYGFGIYYYWFSGKRLLEKPIDIILNNKKIKFKFLLIWANEDWTRRWNGFEGKILIRQEYEKCDPYNFIEDIKKYIIDQRYIKINNKAIIGLYEPKKIVNLSNTISTWRESAKKLGLGEIYIINCLNSHSYKMMKDLKLFDATYEFSPRDSLKYFVKDKPYSLYATTLYKDIDYINITDNFPLYRGCMLEFDNSPRKKRKALIYEYYSPEQFFMINKKIIKWTRDRYNESNRFIFINAWNEWGEGTYLEPDKKYGYSSINSLSKALFNKTYNEIKLNLLNFNKTSSIVAIQAHLYYIDLLNEIINKTNNVPFNFDLFISTDSLAKKNSINDYLLNNSKASKFEIIILENKGRDVMPFLIQMKNKFRKYKYICHIHTKKSIYINIGENWRNYLFNNLLGNENIILEIFNDFENNGKIGFIFPENYYQSLLLFGEKLNKLNKESMKYLIKKLFNNHKMKIGGKIEFPMGNMFWAKVNAIFQIFNEEFQNKLPQELGQKDGTIMHGIERIWLYLIKLNGYYYKKIFKHF